MDTDGDGDEDGPFSLNFKYTSVIRYFCTTYRYYTVSTLTCIHVSLLSIIFVFLATAPCSNCEQFKLAENLLMNFSLYKFSFGPNGVFKSSY